MSCMAINKQKSGWATSRRIISLKKTTFKNCSMSQANVCFNTLK